MNIILFGEMGSGKSSIAEYLYKNYFYNIYSLGKKIHSECKIHGNETREELQQYGQMMRKIFGKDVWCRYLCAETLFNENKIVIDDGRQLNEYDYFIELDYIPIGIIVDNQLRIDRLSKRVNYEIDPETFNHETEIQARKCINKCKYKIYNNSNKKELYEQVDEIMNKIIGEI